VTASARSSGLDLVDRGDHRRKGIPDEHRLYALASP
jgi:hypothetical protein